MRKSDVARLEALNVPIIAVSNTYELVSKSYTNKLVYCADWDWWNHHGQRTKQFGYIERWSCASEASLGHGTFHIPYKSSEIWSERNFIATGGNSGFQAIQLAYFIGFRQVALFGFDMGHKLGTKKHYFGEHPADINRVSNYNKFIEHFEKAAPMMYTSGLDVVNCTRDGSRLKNAFPRMPLLKAIANLKYEGKRRNPCPPIIRDVLIAS